MNPSIIIPAFAVVLFVLLERCPGFAVTPRRFFRRYFLTDVIYTVTGYGIGGTIAMSYVSAFTGWVRPVVACISVHRPGPVASVLGGLVLRELGNCVTHKSPHPYSTLWSC